MKSLLLCSTTLLAAASLMAADKDDVTSAAQKLAAADNYSWTSTRSGGGGGGGGGGNAPAPALGKTQKDGLIWYSVTFGDNTTESFLKGTKGAVKGDDGWTAVDLAAAPARGGGGGGGGRGGRGGAFMLRALRTPASEVTNLLGLVKDITKTGDVYAGDLTEDGAKSLLTFGRGRRGGGGGGGGGGEAPTVANPKGSVKFWIKDGAISKYELKVSGTVSFNGNDRDIDRTTTVEIKDVGTTKLALPDEAKSKLEG